MSFVFMNHRDPFPLEYLKQTLLNADYIIYVIIYTTPMYMLNNSLKEVRSLNLFPIKMVRGDINHETQVIK